MQPLSYTSFRTELEKLANRRAIRFVLDKLQKTRPQRNLRSEWKTWVRAANNPEMKGQRNMEYVRDAK